MFNRFITVTSFQDGLPALFCKDRVMLVTPVADSKVLEFGYATVLIEGGIRIQTRETFEEISKLLNPPTH